MWNAKLIAGFVLSAALSVLAYAQSSGAGTLTAQDYAEIQQLYMRYAWAVDTRGDNGMEYARTYTPDGEFRSGEMKVTGHEALAAFNRKLGAPSRVPTHFVTNIVVESAPGGVRSSAYLFVTGGEKPTLNMVGTYRDIVVKTSEGWRFKQRNLYLNGMPPIGSGSN